MFFRCFPMFLISMVAMSHCQSGEKAGKCPVHEPGAVGPCMSECRNDYSCEGDLKCCANPCGGGVCVKSVEDPQPAEKPGTCPANKPGSSGPCMSECPNDFACKGNLKCCSNPCGGGVCVRPVEASQPIRT